MTHLLAFALCLAGFTALALAMRRQQRDVIGRAFRLPTTYALRAAGGGMLLLALGILIGWYGCGLGMVTFSGHSSLAAGVVYGGLVGYAGLRARVGQRR